MCHDRCARSADVLRHPDACIRHLGITALAAQLLYHFDQLVYAGRADWMAARLQPAAGGDGESPGGENVAIQSKADPLPAPGETASLERKHRHDRKGVMKFKYIDLTGTHPGLFVCLLCRSVCRAVK